MTATDELRRLLDERGVEYGTYDEPDENIISTQWEACGFMWDADDREERIYLSADRLITPEQVIAATLGAGTLTAEQVMAIVGKHQPDYCSDTHVCFDWQAIADELNATLGDTDATCERHGDADERDQLKAENARLKQELESVGTAAYLYGRNDLADENAKLRELVSIINERDVLLPCLTSCNPHGCRFYDSDMCVRIANLMRELGIEVGE